MEVCSWENHLFLWAIYTMAMLVITLMGVYDVYVSFYRHISYMYRHILFLILFTCRIMCFYGGETEVTGVNPW